MFHGLYTNTHFLILKTIDDVVNVWLGSAHVIIADAGKENIIANNSQQKGPLHELFAMLLSQFCCLSVSMVDAEHKALVTGIWSLSFPFFSSSITLSPACHTLDGSPSSLDYWYFLQQQHEQCQWSVGSRTKLIERGRITSVPEACCPPQQQRPNVEIEYRDGWMWHHRPSPMQWCLLTTQDDYWYSPRHWWWPDTAGVICAWSLIRRYLVGHDVDGTDREPP